MPLPPADHSTFPTSGPDAEGCLRAFALRTEQRVAPLGVDRRHPRLSWELGGRPGHRGQSQTAYRILVATTPNNLSPGTSDLWDSGEVASDATSWIAYAGRPLVSLQRCYWAVRVRDQDGRWSTWNRSGAWTTGLLDAAQEWSAAWIYAPSLPSDPAEAPPEAAVAPDPWLRKTFSLAARPSRASALIASVGFHELYVNGQRVGDAVLTPNVSDFSQRARYLQYEIADYLQPGRNVVALWLGTGWSIFPQFQRPDRPRGPVVSAQIYLEEAGQVRRLDTDASWKTHPSPNSLLGAWNFQDFGGERYDANQEQPGWATVGHDDTQWVAVATCHPRLHLSADLAEPNRRMTALTPVKITEPEPGVYRVDFGRTFAGFVEVPLVGQSHGTATLEFSEQEGVDQTHRIRSEYVFDASGAGVFASHFNYAVGRWMTLRGLRTAPDAARTRAWQVRNAYDGASAFQCSNELLNTIHATTCWTFENLTIGGYVADCPHRERMGYGGDGHASATMGLLNFQLGPFLTKWNDDWHDVQGHQPAWLVASPTTPEGTERSEHPGSLPYTAPTHWGGGGPAWSGFCVHLPWQLYRFYGDREVLVRSLPVIDRWLQFLESKSSGHLLQRWGGKWDFLGDWLWPDPPKGPHSDTDSTLLFNNCYWVYNLATAGRIARTCGDGPAAARWEQRATEVRQAIHARFYDPVGHHYGDGTQTVLAAVLLADVPPPDARPAVVARLEHEIREIRRGHIHAGITGGALLFQLMLETGRQDLLYLMVNQTAYPGWGYMLSRGATTWWETWEEPQGNLTRLHSSYLYVGAWPLAGVLGLHPCADEPGFRRFRIAPGPVNQPGLEWARGHFDSPVGRIVIDWRRSAGQFELNLLVPPNSRAEVHLPVSAAAPVTESGVALAEATHVKRLPPRGSGVAVEVPSGQYCFAGRALA